MAFNLDKYTSWCDPYADEILDSDPYTSTNWIRSLYKHCEPEGPTIIYYSKWSLDEFTTCLYIYLGY